MSKQKNKSDFKAKSMPELQERGVIVVETPSSAAEMVLTLCCVLLPKLPLSRALERLTIGLGTTSRVGEIKPSSKVESVVIFHYLPTRSVTTLATRVKQDPKKSARRKVREKHGR